MLFLSLAPRLFRRLTIRLGLVQPPRLFFGPTLLLLSLAPYFFGGLTFRLGLGQAPCLFFGLALCLLRRLAIRLGLPLHFEPVGHQLLDASRIFVVQTKLRLSLLKFAAGS